MKLILKQRNLSLIMANICDNTMFVSSENRANLDAVINFLNATIEYYDCDDGGDYLDIYFDSKWVFPEELMQRLFEAIPDKSDIYMRCLSVEYGCLYHALWICDNNGWKEV